MSVMYCRRSTVVENDGFERRFDFTNSTEIINCESEIVVSVMGEYSFGFFAC